MKLMDKITYTYIKGIKKWMECPVCHEKMTFKKSSKEWKCDHCLYSISEEEFLDDFVFWFCDGCESYLNVQPGFNRKRNEWICTECGLKNDITFANIKGQCKDCGILLDNPNATICSDCKTIRMKKAQMALETVSDICYTLSDALKETDSTEINEGEQSD